MNKSEALQQIIVALQRDLDGLQAAVKVAHESATHGESVAENKYDTRGLEASYLAHGQAKRAAEIEAALRLYQAIVPESLSDQATAVTISSLVELKDQHGVVRWVWPGVDAGGVKFVFEGNDVTIITPQSPLGAVLMGREVGDTFELNPEGRSSGRLQNDLTMEYEIMTIY
ncbi:MAG: GreA/GreB family elongation factor [Gammaproteobacteria bacterium]|nr:GreA/GreB family elongation factor [Gammaproteobacteria bacterium]